MKILNKMKRNAYRAIGKMAAALLLLGMSGACVMDASAAEAGIEQENIGAIEGEYPLNQQVTYIYHQHIGSGEKEGGCYRKPIYHVHKGNEAEGGECYQTPVYHVHKGDEQSGGECYGTPVYHQHTGNPETGGGCFEAVYHKHSSGCYNTVSSSEYGCYIVRYWDTTEGDYEGHDFQYYEMSCGVTVHGTNSSHTHKVLVCKKEDEIVGYALGCNKTDKTVESYAFDCEKIPGITIDSYRFDCSKTEKTVDGYGLSCGKDEKIPYGKAVITEYPGKDKRKTEVEITFEDMTGGELKFTDTPYTWMDRKGKVIGTGSRITVTKNGTYHVLIGIANEDVNRESLKSQISISSIEAPKNNDEDDDGNDDDQGGSDDQGGDDEESGEDRGDPEPTGVPAASPSSAPTATASPSQTPKVTGKEKKNDDDKEKDKIAKDTSDKNAKASKTPGTTPLLETKEVTLPKKESENKDLEEIKVLETEDDMGNNGGIFSSPVVQIISITAGTLTALAGLFLLIYLLFMTARVYNDDGNGKMVYLGRCRIRLKTEGYTIEITDRMAEKAITNRYCIKPGFFRLLRSAEEEIMVCRLKKRVSVFLSKEMIVVI